MPLSPEQVRERFQEDVRDHLIAAESLGAEAAQMRHTQGECDHCGLEAGAARAYARAKGKKAALDLPPSEFVTFLKMLRDALRVDSVPDLSELANAAKQLHRNLDATPE